MKVIKTITDFVKKKIDDGSWIDWVLPFILISLVLWALHIAFFTKY